MKSRREIKLILPKKEKEFLKEGEQLIIKDITDNVITLVKPRKAGGIEQFRGLWKNMDVDKAFHEIAKQWKSWQTHK